MRFMHISDVRLGSVTESGTHFGKAREEEREKTLQHTVKEAAKEGCELLVISGGLFAHQPVTAELAEINRLFCTTPSMEIVLLAGESDMLRKNSPVRSFQWAPNVHYVASEEAQALTLDRIGVTVLAASFTEHAADGLSKVLSLKTQTKPGGIFILAAYEEDQERARELLLSAGSFSYAALGGHSKHQELLPMRAYYCGGLEPDGMADGGEHGAYIGDIGEDGVLKNLRFVPLASVSYVPLVVSVNEGTSGEALSELIEKEIQTRGEQHIYRLRITGKKDPDAVFDLETLTKRYRIAEIIDETEPQYDFAALFAEHPQDMIGYYISSLRKNEAELSEIERKAMYYGIDALLKTADKGGAA